MVYIKRDSDKKICAICKKDSEADLEHIDDHDPEVLQFLMQNGADKSLLFLNSDLELIRVIEDLVSILMKKNLISITDFPPPVIEKLINRNKVRTQFQDIPFSME